MIGSCLAQSGMRRTDNGQHRRQSLLFFDARISRLSSEFSDVSTDHEFESLTIPARPRSRSGSISTSKHLKQLAKILDSEFCSGEPCS